MDSCDAFPPGEYKVFSGSVPFTSLVFTSVATFTDRNPIVRPSRDQLAVTSSPGSKVNRDAVPLFKSSIQMSTLFAFTSARSTATCASSGDSDGFAITPGSPSRDSSFPLLSYHAKTDLVAPVLGLYTTVPFSPAANAA